MIRKLLLLLALCGTACATTQVIVGGEGTNNMVTSAARYHQLAQGSASWTATESNTQMVIASAGTFQGWCAFLSAAPGGSASYQFQVSVNGSTVGSPSVTISASATSGCDASTALAVTAGQLVSVKVTPSGSPTAVLGYWSLKFTPTTQAETLILGGGSSATPSTTTAQYNYAFGKAAFVLAAVIDTRQNVIASGGTIKNLYVSAVTDPTPGSYAFTVFKNGVGTGVTCTIAAGSTSCHDTTHNFSVVAGDRIEIESNPGASPATSIVQWGMTFAATTDGESLISTQGGANNAATRYFSINGGATANASEAPIQMMTQGATIKSMQVWSNTAPGTGKSYLVTLRTNGADSGLFCSVADTGQSCSYNSTSYSATTNDLLDTSVVPSGTPATATISVGFVSYVSPVAPSVRRMRATIF